MQSLRNLIPNSLWISSILQPPPLSHIVWRYHTMPPSKNLQELTSLCTVEQRVHLITHLIYLPKLLLFFFSLMTLFPILFYYLVPLGKKNILFSFFQMFGRTELFTGLGLEDAIDIELWRILHFQLPSEPALKISCNERDKKATLMEYSGTVVNLFSFIFFIYTIWWNGSFCKDKIIRKRSNTGMKWEILIFFPH